MNTLVRTFLSSAAERIALGSLLLLTLASSGCDRVVSDAVTAPMPAPAQDAPVEARAVTLDLVDIALDEEHWTVDVYYSRSADQAAPRVMELSLGLGDGLRFEHAVAGEALERADKDLVAQVRDDGTLRLVAFASSNVNRIESGPLARLSFTVTDAASARLELMPRLPIFAPNDANLGMILAEPLGLNGERP